MIKKSGFILSIFFIVIDKRFKILNSLGTTSKKPNIESCSIGNKLFFSPALSIFVPPTP